MKIEERIDKIKNEIRKTSFLNKKNLGGEISFWIFDYPADKELLIREQTEKLITNLKQEDIIVKNINLYEIAMSIILEKVPLKQLLDYEDKKGSNELLIKLRTLLNINSLNEKIKSCIEEKDEIIFLTGVGNAWPLIRAHTILNNAQSYINKPFIVFYPGKYSRDDLSLFGLLDAKNYYRAQRLIDYAEGEN